MKEIGGYFELENHTGHEYHEGMLHFNLGRTALLYMLRKMGIRKLYLPFFMCGSVIDYCRMGGVDLSFYRISADFMPLFDGELQEGEGLLLMNYYGQIDGGEIESIRRRFGRVILDNTHAFFSEIPEGMSALLSVRKYFGVSDGAYACIPGETQEPEDLAMDCSAARYEHILGRYEGTASAYYQVMLRNAETYHDAPILRMSALTRNFLRGIDYDMTKNRREANYRALQARLERYNDLKPVMAPGPFCYPFYCRDSENVRKILSQEKIYVPVYWRNVIESTDPASIEYDYAAHILPLPCDQRYLPEDMERVADALLRM